MNKKKVIALLLAFAMMIPVFLTACNKETDKKPDDKQTTTNTENTDDTANNGEETPDGEDNKEVDPSQMKISKLDELNVASATQVATYDYVLSSKT